MKITSVEYIDSAFEKSRFPRDCLPEIAFAGRSNVGKSSLLNCLVGKGIAKISGTPGKTRAINFFLINKKFYLVDLPGYGYARVSKQMRKGWQKLMESYIGQRSNLRATIVIIDVRRDPIPDADLQMIEFLNHVEVPCIPVFTKVDKLSRSEMARKKKLLSRQLPAGAQPSFFSAITRDGLNELDKRVADCLA
jgi:GTP-binding protein